MAAASPDELKKLSSASPSPSVNKLPAIVDKLNSKIKAEK
jgi:hypothetical protein